MSTVLIGGGSGLVGSRLSKMLLDKGYKVAHLSRSPDKSSDIPVYHWDINEQVIDDEAIRQADYIINLAGAGIADKRWSESRKKLIVESRVKTIDLLLSGIRRLGKEPKAFLSAAAVGYYGDRGSEWVTEESDPGEGGFLVESCLKWEEAISRIGAAGLRAVTYRIGIVLSTKGGALAKMILPAKFGMSSVFGDGKQYMSWVHIDDLCSMFIKGIEDAEMAGTFNAVAPHPATNKDFMTTLAGVLNRPALTIPVPGALLKLALGEMADVVLSGSRVSAEKIQEQGFDFQFEDLESALQDVIEREV